MRVEWSATALASGRRFMRDQDGMRSVTQATAALAINPLPSSGFHRGRYHRVRVGHYRVMYVIDDDVITIERVDRVSGS